MSFLEKVGLFWAMAGFAIAAGFVGMSAEERDTGTAVLALLLVGIGGMLFLLAGS